jgi:energy-coupling factor transport system permease protein
LAFGLFITGYFYGGGYVTGLNIATRTLAFFGLGMIFTLSTDPYNFIKSLQRDARLPRKFAYGILCAYNLMPYIKNEYKNARLALKVRGVRVSIFSIKPVFSTLVNSVRWSETLTIAMRAKGFNEDKKISKKAR